MGVFILEKGCEHMDRTTKLRISNSINALAVLTAFCVLVAMLLKQPLVGQFSVSITDIHFLLITTLWILAIVVILYVLPGLWILNTSCRIHLVPTFSYLTNNKNDIPTNTYIVSNTRTTLCVCRC